MKILLFIIICLPLSALMGRECVRFRKFIKTDEFKRLK